ncbi:DNA-3-methyladenine glycosylase I [Coraliomargarita parva]|uniref:DNA-3-methyladenine glycosylase I n=1 Tax=Coraliomargarita parva TaxID=3014050 RepID=UPI0022B36CC9|nr:DNA-3-methyladenine glycosylase I [Coraliomargarita parva]
MCERCEWCLGSDLYREYHDKEWGVPLWDDRMLFEFLILEGAQAGLSWITILNKRAHYRKVYDGFDPEKIAAYDEAKVAELLADPGIVRNRLKVAASITNAQAYLKLVEREGAFAPWIWQFVGGQTKQNAWRSLSEVPASTPESDAMSKALKKEGFRFVGSTICYAFMQATGMVNDHVTGCFRHGELGC